MPLALAIWFGFIDEIGVEGPRPRKEIASALNRARPAFSTCIGDGGVLAIEFDILAAGFVDRVTVIDRSGALDEECVVSSLRSLSFAGRGREPPTRALVHVAATPHGARPNVVAFRDALDAIDLHRDDIRRCLQREGMSRVLIKFAVENGAARDIVVAPERHRDGAASPALAVEGNAVACVALLVTRTHFPAASAGAHGVLTLPVAPASDVARRARHTPQAPTLFSFLGCG